MVNNKNIYIDLDRVLPQDVISIHVNDLNSIFLHLTITKSGVIQDVSGLTVEYDATIANVVAEQDAAGSISDNKVVIPVTSNMVAISGLLLIDVRLIDGTQVLHTQMIKLNVERSVIDGSASIDISGTTIYARLTAVENAANAATAAVSGKADKVSGATLGNFAKFDSNGNLADSGYDFQGFVRWDEEVDTESLSNDVFMVPSSHVISAELAKKAPKILRVSIASGDWDSNSDAYVTVEGATGSSLIIWQYAPSNVDVERTSPIYLAFVSNTGRLRFHAVSAVPTGTININLIVQN